MIDDDLVRAHRGAGADPGASGHPRHGAQPRHLLPGARDGEPVLRRACRGSCSSEMDRFAGMTGRQYHLFDYHGARGCGARHRA